MNFRTQLASGTAGGASLLQEHAGEESSHEQTLSADSDTSSHHYIANDPVADGDGDGDGDGDSGGDGDPGDSGSGDGSSGDGSDGSAVSVGAETDDTSDPFAGPGDAVTFSVNGPTSIQQCATAPSGNSSITFSASALGKLSGVTGTVNLSNYAVCLGQANGANVANAIVTGIQNAYSAATGSGKNAVGPEGTVTPANAGNTFASLVASNIATQLNNLAESVSGNSSSPGIQNGSLRSQVASFTAGQDDAAVTATPSTARYEQTLAESALHH